MGLATAWPHWSTTTSRYVAQLPDTSARPTHAATWRPVDTNSATRESTRSATEPATPISRTVGRAKAAMSSATPSVPPPWSWTLRVSAIIASSSPTKESVRAGTTSRRSRCRQSDGRGSVL